jgi:hypothetical protein
MARWDKRARVWRQRELAGEAFVADRARLLARLRQVRPQADLWSSLAEALRASNGGFGRLGEGGAWAVSASGVALKEAAPRLIGLAEAGLFPTHLAKRPSAALDEPGVFSAWERLMRTEPHASRHAMPAAC